MTDSLYNPDTMSKEDIKTLFVARQPLLDEIVSTIKNQPQGAGVQHILIIAPRGMGKTTMLLMLQFAVEDSKELSKDWQAIRFPEESYDITELADFWIKVLRYLADATNADEIETKIKEIEDKFTKSEDLREAGWALVKDWSKRHKKRLVLLVDNFDMILSQIGSQTEQARLRDILMNDGTVMLIGCAPSYFHEIQDYEQPLYNFFKIYNLSDLKFADIEELLRRRAEIDEIPNIEELLQKNKTRIKALEAFTGGNPRLVLMLYRIITSSDMTEVRKGLERLLDAVTPYYKDKTERLPAQQRKIINEIAQYSLEKSEGVSPTEIAQRIRMTPNQVNTQLKRLSDNGYVKALNIRGRSSFYALSEPLYAIWAQMRFGRNSREKRNWLVQILKALFDVQEIQIEIEKQTERIKRLKHNGHVEKVRGLTEYLICLIETNPVLIENNLDLAIEGYLVLKEIGPLKDAFNKTSRIRKKFVDLSPDILTTLSEKGVIHRLDHLEMALRSMSEFYDLSNSRSKIREELEYELNLSDSSSNNETTEKKSDEYAALVLSGFYVWKATIQVRLNKKLIIFEYDRAIDLLNKNGASKKSLKLLFMLYLMKINILLIQDKKNEAKAIFTDFINSIKERNIKNWVEIAIRIIVRAARFFRLQSIYEIIQDSDYKEELSPLIRAFEYLETKDRTLVEKLSPEVRIVVEETISTLQLVFENNKTDLNQTKSERGKTHIQIKIEEAEFAPAS